MTKPIQNSSLSTTIVDEKNETKVHIYYFNENNSEFEALWENGFWQDVSIQSRCLITTDEIEEMTEPKQLRILIKIIKTYQENGYSFKMLIALKEIAEKALKYNSSIEFSF